jgi:hypothetical protein
MNNIIEQLKDLYVTDKAACLNMLPKLFKKYDEGLIPVLPCKVGDKIYTTKCGDISEVKVRTFFIGNPSYNRGETSQSIEMVRTTKFDIPFENFGKTVFLTREEAEKALKECEHYEQRRNIKKSD